MASYMGNDNLEGFLWDISGDKDKLCEILKSYKNKTKAQWGKFFDTAYPMYQELVKSGKFAAYQIGTSAGNKLIEAMIEKTGFYREDMQNFLNALQSGAKLNQISASMWNPALPGREQLDPASEAARLALAAAKKAKEQAAGIILPIVIGVVGVALIVYAPAINRMLPKKGESPSPAV